MRRIACRRYQRAFGQPRAIRRRLALLAELHVATELLPSYPSIVQAHHETALRTIVCLDRGPFLMVVPAHRHARLGYLTVTDQQRMLDRLPRLPLATLPTA